MLKVRQREKNHEEREEQKKIGSSVFNDVW